MDNTLLTAEEINHVQKLVAKKGYTFVDVQHEILDHVLCAIEEKRKADPNLGIDQAFHEVHASFGIFGFAGIEEAMQKSVQKKLWKDFWYATKSLFSADKFSIVVLLILLPYALYYFSDALRLAFLPYFAMVLLSIGSRIYAYRRRPGAKKFLIFQMAFSMSLVSFPMGYYLFTFAFNFAEMEMASTRPWLLLIIIPILCMFEVISLFAFQRALKRAKEHISKYGIAAIA